MSRSDCDEDDYEDDYDSYYPDDADIDPDQSDYLSSSTFCDLEHFEFECLVPEVVEKRFNEDVAKLQSSLNICPALAKLLLHRHGWNLGYIEDRYRMNAYKFLCESHLLPESSTLSPSDDSCSVCLRSSVPLQEASCSHTFCKDCWSYYIDVQVQAGHSTDIECMSQNCKVILQEDLVLDMITRPQTREKYQRFSYEDYVNMHPKMKPCSGPGCSMVLFAKEKLARRVTCSLCNTQFCFRCGIDYHAPTACDTIKRWLTKCVDDSETANYISANTKDCPQCHVCIEKNGGCNHMQCFKCKYDFCWMCLGEWKAHAGEYYECSRYKENPKVVTQDKTHQAREALLKYLHYFTRWENHANSLKLEAKEKLQIQEKIESKVLAKHGTWIDWQYLIDATELLKRCRYTLQYTYPYAYYLDKDPRKELFEYQQGKLEAEVENLSWKIQKAEITDRGDLENQMDIVEKMRQTLLKDFLQS